MPSSLAYSLFCRFGALKIAEPSSPGEAVFIGLALSSLIGGASLVHTFWENRPLMLTVLHEAYHAVVLSANAWLLHRYFL